MELSSITKNFLNKFKNELLTRNQCEKVITLIENNEYNLSHRDRIIIIYDLRQLHRNLK